MTRDEFLRISQILKSVFTSPSFMAGKEGMEVWYRALQDLDYKTVCETKEEYEAERERLAKIDEEYRQRKAEYLNCIGIY